MRRARWLLVVPLFAVGYFTFRASDVADWLAGPPKPNAAIPPQPEPPGTLVAAAALPPDAGAPIVPVTQQPPPAPLPPPVFRQPENVPENLPQGLRTPPANFGRDGGTVFPVDPKGIKAALAEAMPEMKECYESWHKLNPELEGTLELSFNIGTPDGGDEAEIDRVHLYRGSSMNNALFEGCVLSVVSGLRFEPPQGTYSRGVEVRFPMTFASSEPDAGR